MNISPKMTTKLAISEKASGLLIHSIKPAATQCVPTEGPDAAPPISVPLPGTR